MGNVDRPGLMPAHGRAGGKRGAVVWELKPCRLYHVSKLKPHCKGSWHPTKKCGLLSAGFLRFLSRVREKLQKQKIKSQKDLGIGPGTKY